MDRRERYKQTNRWKDGKGTDRQIDGKKGKIQIVKQMDRRERNLQIHGQTGKEYKFKQMDGKNIDSQIDGQTGKGQKNKQKGLCRQICGQLGK